MDTLKLVDTKYTSYDDERGYVIVEVQIQGNATFFKIPTYSNSDGGQYYEFNKATPVVKKEKNVTVWE